jgi:N-acetylmuramic acid 6-phosphate etherase
MPDQPLLGNLLTESRNPASEHLDQLPTLAMLELINDEDTKVAAAVRTQLPQIAQAIDAIASRFEQGGRLFYIGAGTSGRLGVLDASECPPTFSVDPTLFQGLIAGGDRALRLSSEHSEDSPEEGARDLIAAGFGQSSTLYSLLSTPCSSDTLIGIAASGRTPYVLGALAHAKSFGALTIALTCVPNSPIAQAADIAITPATGPEVLTGSTRLKAGTATKLVLNMLSTGIMVRRGATYGNLMINVRPTNAKLIDRAHRIIMAATGCDAPTAATLLTQSDNNVKTAIAMQKLNLTREAAESRLSAAKGILSATLISDL